MNKRPLQVSPFLVAAHSTSSEVFDFSYLVFTGLSDAVEASTLGFLTLHRETKFIIGFDFAVTLSSPASFLRSFRHRIKTIGRTEMASVEQTQKDDSIHHV